MLYAKFVSDNPEDGAGIYDDKKPEDEPLVSFDWPEWHRLIFEIQSCHTQAEVISRREQITRFDGIGK